MRIMLPQNRWSLDERADALNAMRDYLAGKASLSLVEWYLSALNERDLRYVILRFLEQQKETRHEP